MSSQNRYSAETLKQFVRDLLKRLDTPPADADHVAHALIRAHLRGYDTHGLPCLAGYVSGIEEKRLNPDPSIKFEQRRPWVWTVDGDNGLGQVVAMRAMDKALAAAADLGIGAAAVRRSNHFGAAGVYALQAAEKDCIGIVSSNNAAVTAPYGAAEPILGTNPISVAVPAGTYPAFAIDMATSEGSRKKIKKALEEGYPIPAGWALASDGNPTTDPAAALNGVMLPFGGLKGSAISLLIDVLSGVLTGAAFGGGVLNVFTNHERESNNGHFILVMKVDAFLAVADFKQRMDEELKRILKLRPNDPSQPVLYPGYRSGLKEAQRLKSGIALPVGLVVKLEKIGSRYQVGFPQPLI